MVTIEKVKQYAEKYSVLLVEDDLQLRATTVPVLEMIFPEVDAAENGKEGLELYSKKKHRVVITDIEMPVMNGVDLVKAIRNINPRQPIIVISGHEEAYYLIQLINQGIHHFLPKPFEIQNFLNILERVLRYMKLQELELDYQRQLEDEVAQRTSELNKSLTIISELGEEMVLRLTNAVELRDTHTGAHINRMAMYVELLASVLKLNNEITEGLKFAAPLHDIGKIGIPDDILLKPSELTSEEWMIMRTHTEIGARILENSKYERVNVACSAALNHHECWNGSGYPHGLKGDDIPLEGRIIAICDVYDALRSQRPYKNAVDHEEACRRILEGDDRSLPSNFDPYILDAFKELCNDIRDIYDRTDNVVSQ